MLRILISLAIVISILTVLTSVVPNPLTAQINASFVYFLSYVHSLDNIFDTSALLSALQIFFNFMAGLLVFWMMFFVYKLISGGQAAK